MVNKATEGMGKYPNALSRAGYSEGGYTFLHRVFREHFKTKQPVVISTGNLFLQYEYNPSHQSFSDGISVLEGNDPESLKAFMSVADAFEIEKAFAENNIQRPIMETRNDIQDLL